LSQAISTRAKSRPATLRFAGIGVFVVVLVVYLISPVKEVTDSYWTVYTSVSLLKHGDATLDEYPAALKAADGFQVTRHAGHDYYSVPPATAVLAAPLVALDLLVDGGHLQHELDTGAKPSLDPVIAAVFTALAAAFVWGFSRRVLGRDGPALLATATFAFGTVAWSTVSRSLWMHGPSMACIAGAVWLATIIRDGDGRSRRGRDLASPALGAVLGLAVMVRPTNAVIVLGLLIWMAWSHRERLVPFVVAGGVVGLAFAALDEHLYGLLLSPYDAANRLAVSSKVPVALAGNLVSPSRGLFIFSPVLLLCVVGIVLMRRKGALSGLEAAFGAAIVLQWVAVSFFPHWWGGWAYGPRFLSDVLPLFIWFLLPVIASITSQPRSAHGRLRPLTIAFIALFALSCLINFRGAFVESTFTWNFRPANVDLHPSRLWDWAHAQFLA
jgi:hypothetical protein